MAKSPTIDQLLANHLQPVARMLDQTQTGIIIKADLTAWIKAQSR